MCVDVGAVYFCMSSVLVTVSKDLRMSIVERIVRCAGFGAFMPSCMCCVSVVRSVIVEFFGSEAVLD